MRLPSGFSKNKNGQRKFHSGTSSMTEHSFNKIKRKSQRSMMNLNHNTSYSHTRFNTNHSLGSINGTETFLSRFSTKQNFETKHNKIINNIKENLEKCSKIRGSLSSKYSNEDQLFILNSENNILRKNLKNLNDYLSKFLKAARDLK